jgi:hypothetical protein
VVSFPQRASLDSTIDLHHRRSVEPKPSHVYLAHELPRIDDHLVQPETRQEMVRGVRMEASANPPHADRQHMLDQVIGAHVAPGYVGATELLTRFSPGSNFAADLCIRKQGSDAHGVRHLEELAFEVVSEQSRRDVTLRAEDMVARGVRRVIAVFVKSSTVEQWNPIRKRFEPLDPAGELVDPTLTRAIPVRALLDAALGYDEIAKAVDLKRVPYMTQIREEAARAAKSATLTRMLERRFGPLETTAKQRLVAATPEQLDVWLDRLLDAATLDDVLG